jgi:hypothetical protein
VLYNALEVVAGVGLKIMDEEDRTEDFSVIVRADL